MRGRTGGLSRRLHDCDGVVVEDCGDIFGGELVGGVTDEETCLSDRTVTDDNASVDKDGLAITKAKHDQRNVMHIATA